MTSNADCGDEFLALRPQSLYIRIVVSERTLLARLALIEVSAVRLARLLCSGQPDQRVGTFPRRESAVGANARLCRLIRVRDEVGLTSLIHLACRDRNLLGLQSEIMGMGVLGFRHMLALTGDPAKVGQALDWHPTVKLPEIVERMIRAEREGAGTF